MLKSAIKPYYFISPDFYVTAILFACCYVTRWDKFGRAFCKQTSVAASRFQNECNKVEIALCVVQFWSEIKLVITNRTLASRLCDFVITRLISNQIALYSVQLPLLIGSKRNFISRPFAIQKPCICSCDKIAFRTNKLLLILKVKISGNAKLFFLHDKTCGHRK